MAEIIKIALLGIAGVLFAIQFRQQRPEYALLIGFALSILVFSFVCRMAGNLLEEFRGLQQYLGDSKGYLGILMKVVGITYLCEFSAGIFYYLGAQPAWHYYISIALLVFVSGGIKVYLGARKCNLSIKKYVKSVIIRIVLYCGVLTLYYKLWNYWKITDTIYSLAFQFVIIVFISGCFALSQDEMKLIKKYLNK